MESRTVLNKYSINKNNFLVYKVEDVSQCLVPNVLCTEATECLSGVLSVVLCRFNKHLDKALVDTGSTYTILRSEYKFLVGDDRGDAPDFHAANGTSIKVYGKKQTCISLDNVVFDHDAI